MTHLLGNYWISHLYLKAKHCKSESTTIPLKHIPLHTFSILESSSLPCMLDLLLSPPNQSSTLPNVFYIKWCQIHPFFYVNAQEKDLRRIVVKTLLKPSSFSCINQCLSLAPILFLNPSSIHLEGWISCNTDHKLSLFCFKIFKSIWKLCKESPRILDWVAYPFSNKSSQPGNRNWTRVSCIADVLFYQLSYQGSPIPYNPHQDNWEPGPRTVVSKMYTDHHFLKLLTFKHCVVV